MTGESSEAFYKEEILQRHGEESMLLVDCFFAGAQITDVPTGR